jgi:hypothetical protein
MEIFEGENPVDEGHYHEVCDRIHIINSNIEDFLLKTPVCDKHPEIREKIEKASELLSEAYQMSGERF